MQIALIHNPTAGDSARMNAERLLELIRAAGHEVLYQSSKARNWERLLDEPVDLVVAAGGDGTVARVARRMVGRHTPLAALPLGTANNIAKSLGLAGIGTEALIEGWRSAHHVQLDAGTALGTRGRENFVEGLGVGLFAWAVPRADSNKKLAQLDNASEAIAYALKMLKRRLRRHGAERVEASLDGRDISGDYVMFEVMNMQYIGPNLFLAPEGRADDGWFDVVAVTEAARADFERHLDEWIAGIPSAPRFTTFRGRELRMEQGAYDVHVDDKIWGGKHEPLISGARSIEVRILPDAIDFLMPAQGGA